MVQNNGEVDSQPSAEEPATSTSELLIGNSPPEPSPSKPKARKRKTRRRTEADVVARAFPSAPTAVKAEIAAGLGVADGGSLLGVKAHEGNAVIIAAFDRWALTFAARYRDDPRVRDNKVQSAVLTLAAERGLDVEFLFFNRKAESALARLLREVCGNTDIFALQAAAEQLR